MPQPKAHKYKRAKRLSCARTWIETYKGKTLYHGYAKHFGVNKLCAILELEMLGYVFPDELKESVKRSEIDKQVQREKRKAKKDAENDLVESDEYFAYIAGYTSGGAAYGVTWEEMEEIEKMEEKQNNQSKPIDFKEDLPF